jgi:tetratricopeptide (TPR) repeat protein
MPDTRLPDQRARLLDEFEQELAEGDTEGAAQCLRALQSMLPEGDAELLYARARFTWVEEGQEAAFETLEQVVALDPRHSDAQYDLGRIAERSSGTSCAFERSTPSTTATPDSASPNTSTSSTASRARFSTDYRPRSGRAWPTCPC